MKKNVHVYIGTPMYGGMCAGQYTLSMLQFIPKILACGWAYTFLFRYNESLITRARNAIVSNFMDTNATHLLFIDADIGFNPDDIVKMIHEDKDIICGIYPTKAINWSRIANAVKSNVPDEELGKHTANWVVNFKNYNDSEEVQIDKPFEVMNAGTGMMLIKRKVFDELKEKVPHYIVNEADPMMKNKIGKKIPEYFTTSIDPISGVLLSEDYHFCRIWRENGGTIWAAPWVELDHVGTYVFSGRPERI